MRHAAAIVATPNAIKAGRRAGAAALLAAAKRIFGRLVVLVLLVAVTRHAAVGTLAPLGRRTRLFAAAAALRVEVEVDARVRSDAAQLVEFFSRKCLDGQLNVWQHCNRLGSVE